MVELGGGGAPENPNDGAPTGGGALLPNPVLDAAELLPAPNPLGADVLLLCPKPPETDTLLLCPKPPGAPNGPGGAAVLLAPKPPGVLALVEEAPNGAPNCGAEACCCCDGAALLVEEDPNENG